MTLRGQILVSRTDDDHPCSRVWIQRFNTSRCVPAPRVHVSTHLRVVPVHTVTFWMYTRRRFWIHTFFHVFSACRNTHKHTYKHTHTKHTQRPPTTPRPQRHTDRERERRQRKRDRERETREDETRQEKMKEEREERRWKTRSKRKWREIKMKRGDREDFSKKCFRTLKPPDELGQNVSKKFLSDELFLHFSSKVQNLTVFSLVYMIRIRFFGPGELNQRTLGPAQYQVNLIGVTTKTSKV